MGDIYLIAACLGLALAGGWLSRMCGGAPPKLLWGLDQWLYAFPYMIVSLPSAIALLAYFASPKSDIVLSSKRLRSACFIALAPYMLAFSAKRTGHGGGIDLGTSSKEPFYGRDPEKLEYIILFLHGKIPTYWYDALLLSITGIAVTLVPSLLIMFVDIYGGLLILVSGVLKAPAYMIGAWIYPQRRGKGIPYLNEATAIGEFLTGFFGYGAIAIAASRMLF